MRVNGRKPDLVTLTGVKTRIKSTYHNHAVARVSKTKYLCCSEHTASFDDAVSHPDFLGVFNRNIHITDLMDELQGSV